ncbi:hypothetical protein [Bradyrhizobium sp. CCBAU 45384]|nr:hypothetical protein [Bradyrhizobium sp. CCBAU 45384]
MTEYRSLLHAAVTALVLIASLPTAAAAETALSQRSVFDASSPLHLQDAI